MFGGHRQRFGVDAHVPHAHGAKSPAARVNASVALAGVQYHRPARGAVAWMPGSAWRELALQMLASPIAASQIKRGFGSSRRKALPSQEQVQEPDVKMPRPAALLLVGRVPTPLVQDVSCCLMATATLI